MTEKRISTYRNKQLENGFIKIPHVVILGAGASKAAFPNGDLNGSVLPLMENFVEVVGLRDVLSLNGIKYEGVNIETIFSNVADDPEKEKLKKLLEEQIFDYFAKMQIQDELTIYDKLILSLRDKDIVATFNWDPLLLYAYRRCGNYYKSSGIKMPTLIFLHGNVALGVCYKDNVLGPMDSSCSKCSKRFTQVPLLYPVLKKNYTQNMVIKEQWERLKYHIRNAYFVTIFGYSAPNADYEAVKLMHEVWQDNPRKELSEIEIIDIKDRPVLYDTWKKFITREHYRTWKDINGSYLFQHPRRSIEAFFDCFLQNSPWPEEHMPDYKTFAEVVDWLKPLLEEEREIIPQ